MSIVQLSPLGVGITADFMRRHAPELARDIVCQLDGAAKLAETYGLTDMQWMVLKTWPAFVRMVQEANEELGGSAGTLERARRKAALAVSEMGVHDLAEIAGNAKVASGDRIRAIQTLVEIGGVSMKQQAAAGSTGVVSYGGALIQIVMPAGQQLQIGVADVEAKIPVIEGESHRVGVSELHYDEGDA